MATASPPVYFQMQRFMKDQAGPPLFSPMSQSQTPRFSQPVTPLPALSQGRQESPFPLEPSSCSSVQSPFQDSELYTDNSPSTPQDLTTFSSYQVAQCDGFDASTQRFSQMGNYAVDSPCVSMQDVYQRSQFEMNDFDGDVAFNGLQQDLSFEIQGSAYHFDNEDMTVPIPMVGGGSGSNKHMSSSEGMSPAIKEEIYVHETSTNAYPLPEEDEDESEVEVDSIQAQIKDEDEDDDDDYQPSTTRKPTSPRASRRGLKSTKRPSQERLAESAPTKRQKTAISPAPAKVLPPSPTGNRGSLQCPDCPKYSKDEATLQSHIKKQHTRPFNCVFNFAGCTSTFASKNEWKRHVNSQHLVLEYWLCDLEPCAHVKNGAGGSSPSPSSSSRSSKSSSRRKSTTSTPNRQSVITHHNDTSSTFPNGSIFNRKDLYTQHVRRMHKPAHISKHASSSSSSSSKKSTNTPPSPATAAWDEQIKRYQTQATRPRCQLPTYMECPASGCGQHFEGDNAWDHRMEHVAQHLERAASGEEAPISFGGEGDETLMGWATRGDVDVVRMRADGSGWGLNNPLKPEGTVGNGNGGRRASAPVVETGRGSAATRHVYDGEEDAEGEDEY